MINCIETPESKTFMFSDAVKSLVAQRALIFLQCNVVCVTCISVSQITSLKDAEKSKFLCIEYNYL